jgi:hypothetical protein
VPTSPASESLTAVAPTTAADPTLERLESEIRWYDEKSTRSQRLFKWLKFVEILAAAAIPVVAALGAPIEIGAVLGSLIVVLEGLQHVNQYQSNWISYRSTCEALRHEKYLFLARAGPYAVERAHALLAERIEGLISQEHAKWVSAREEPVQPSEQRP